MLLAKAYYFNGQFQAANGHFEKAFEIMSAYVRKTGNRAAKGFYLSFEKEILFEQISPFTEEYKKNTIIIYEHGLIHYEKLKAFI